VLQRLSIRNFKTWRDTGSVRLAPLTVFLGSNSSGKSSLLQFLRLLRQSVDSPDRRQVLSLGDDASEVSIGTFADWIFAHDISQSLEFRLAWDLLEPIQTSGYNLSDLEFHSRIRANGNGRLHLDRFCYASPDGFQLGLHAVEDGKFDVADPAGLLVRRQGRPWVMKDPLHFHGFPDDLESRFQNSGIASDLTFALTSQLRRIHYLGPLREQASRRYIWSGAEPEAVGKDGRSTIAALLAGADRSISPQKHKPSRPLAAAVEQWLERFGLLKSFSARQIEGVAQMYEVRVRAHHSEVDTHLPDVGFGVSQVLPVIVQALYTAPGSTLLMEQPELHLHPRAEAFLADLFIETVQSRQAGQNRNIQLIVETHSEHFVYRLQRLIAEEQILPADVALYFCRPGPNGSSIESLQLSDTGDIANWPDDFFGDEMEDTRQRLNAIAARMGKV
jgi:predicted ATPase